MKTNKKKLCLIADYFKAKSDTARHRLWAEQSFVEGHDANSWHYLVLWAEARHRSFVAWIALGQDIRNAICARGQA